jgi:hypothetical protein
MSIKATTKSIPREEMFVDVEIACSEHPEFKTTVRLNKVEVDKAWKENKAFKGTYDYCSQGCRIEFEIPPTG